MNLKFECLEAKSRRKRQICHRSLVLRERKIRNPIYLFYKPKLPPNVT